MRFDPFPDQLKEKFAESAGPALRRLLADDPDLNPKAVCTWHETCRVLTLDLPKRYSKKAPLARFIRFDKDLWHHQIKVDGQPVLYARSILEGDSCRLVQLVCSVIANRFDASLSLLDSMHSDATVRLLQIPGYKEERFALFEREEIVGLVPLRQGLETQGILAVEESVAVAAAAAAPTVESASSLLERYRGKPQLLGLRSA